MSERIITFGEVLDFLQEEADLEWFRSIQRNSAAAEWWASVCSTITRLVSPPPLLPRAVDVMAEDGQCSEEPKQESCIAVVLQAESGSDADVLTACMNLMPRIEDDGSVMISMKVYPSPGHADGETLELYLHKDEVLAARSDRLVRVGQETVVRFVPIEKDLVLSWRTEIRDDLREIGSLPFRVAARPASSAESGRDRPDSAEQRGQ